MTPFCHHPMALPSRADPRGPTAAERETAPPSRATAARARACFVPTRAGTARARACFAPAGACFVSARAGIARARAGIAPARAYTVPARACFIPARAEIAPARGNEAFSRVLARFPRPDAQISSISSVGRGGPAKGRRKRRTEGRAGHFPPLRSLRGFAGHLFPKVRSINLHKNKTPFDL